MENISATSFVRLRVGGEIFETSRDTLLNDSESVFHVLLRFDADVFCWYTQKDRLAALIATLHGCQDGEQ